MAAIQFLLRLHPLIAILNLTPDSFSHKNLGFLDYAKQSHRLEKFYGVDIGAESTAPMNRPISAAREIERFKKYYTPLKQKITGLNVLSFDTYKIETIDYLLSSKEQNSWWNDISGAYESAVQTLHRYKQLSYVLCHNRARSRLVGADHLQYSDVKSREDIVCEVQDFFSQGLAYLENKGIDRNRIILDPCFGFSKDRMESLDLMTKLPQLIDSFKDQRWLIGISRKSFLRSEEDNKIKGEGKYANADQIAKKYYEKLYQLYPALKIYIRAHLDSI